RRCGGCCWGRLGGRFGRRRVLRLLLFGHMRSSSGNGAPRSWRVRPLPPNLAFGSWRCGRRSRLYSKSTHGKGHHHNHPSTVMPILRAVPSMIRAACSTSRAFRSLNFFLAMSSTWALVTLLPLYLPPFLASGGIDSLPAFLACGIFAAIFRSTAAGGDLILNSKLRSEYTVMTTGSISPFMSGLLVLSLNCFTNMAMLTPWAPSAGPTGGAGVACPPGHWSLTNAVTCLAMVHRF